VVVRVSGVLQMAVWLVGAVTAMITVVSLLRVVVLAWVTVLLRMVVVEGVRVLVRVSVWVLTA